MFHVEQFLASQRSALVFLAQIKAKSAAEFTKMFHVELFLISIAFFGRVLRADKLRIGLICLKFHVEHLILIFLDSLSLCPGH